MSADDLDSRNETSYWLSRPDTRETVAEADVAISPGDTVSSSELRKQLGLPAK